MGMDFSGGSLDDEYDSVKSEEKNSSSCPTKTSRHHSFAHQE